MPHPTKVVMAAVAAALISVPLVQPTFATPGGHGRLFVVTDNRDLPDLQADGVCQAEAGTRSCTLRAALDEINAAGSGHHRIRIGKMAIALTWQDEGLSVNPGVLVSVSGAGAERTTIDGGGPGAGVGIFSVAAGAALNLEGLTLSNGDAIAWGGAILNFGDVYISDAVLSGNRATASGLGGPAGRGGAIFNQPGGRLTLVTTTLADNQSRGSGGAVRNEGFMAIVGSTFSRNDGSCRRRRGDRQQRYRLRRQQHLLGQPFRGGRRDLERRCRAALRVQRHAGGQLHAHRRTVDHDRQPSRRGRLDRQFDRLLRTARNELRGAADIRRVQPVERRELRPPGIRRLARRRRWPGASRRQRRTDTDPCAGAGKPGDRPGLLLRHRSAGPLAADRHLRGRQRRERLRHRSLRGATPGIALTSGACDYCPHHAVTP